MKNKSKKIELYCGICGSADFIIDHENGLYTCVKCSEEYTREEIKKCNQHIIQQSVEDFKQEIVDDFEKEVKKIMKGFK